MSEPLDITDWAKATDLEGYYTYVDAVFTAYGPPKIDPKRICCYGHGMILYPSADLRLYTCGCSYGQKLRDAVVSAKEAEIRKAWKHSF